MKEMVVKLVMLMMIKQLLLLELELLINLPPQLLSVPGLMVLKPVEHILTFNLTIEREVGSDLLDLRCTGSSCSSPIHFFQDHELLWCWTPSRR